MFNSKCIRVLTFERCKIGSSSIAPHVTNSQSHWQGQEAGSQQSLDEFRHEKELSTQLRLFGGDGGQQFSEDIELLGFGNADSDEKLSDIFYGVFQWE